VISFSKSLLAWLPWNLVAEREEETDAVSAVDVCCRADLSRVGLFQRPLSFLHILHQYILHKLVK
jgi:hypothetical protein